MKTSFNLTIHSGKRTKLQIDCWSCGNEGKEVKLQKVSMTRAQMAAIITQALEEMLEGVNNREQEIMVGLYGLVPQSQESNKY